MAHINTAVAVNHLMGMVAEGKLVIKVQGDILGGDFSLPPLPAKGEDFIWKRILVEMKKDYKLSSYLNPNTTYLELSISHRSLHREGPLSAMMNKISIFSRQETTINLPRELRNMLLHIKYHLNPELDNRTQDDSWIAGLSSNVIDFDPNRELEDPHDRRRRIRKSRERAERREHNRKVLTQYGLGKYRR